MFLPLEKEMNYLQNKFSICRHFLKTSLHDRMKHKSLKFGVALPILDDDCRLGLCFQ